MLKKHQEKQRVAMIRVEENVKDRFDDLFDKANLLREEKKKRKMCRSDLISLMVNKMSDKDLLGDNY